MSEKYTIEQIKNYILSQDSLGDVLYNLKSENIYKANVKEKFFRTDIIKNDFELDEESDIIECMEEYLCDKVRNFFDFDTWDDCDDGPVYFEYDGEKYEFNFEYGECIESTGEHRIMRLIPIITLYDEANK